jgi:hypothetical protein
MPFSQHPDEAWKRRRLADAQYDAGDGKLQEIGNETGHHLDSGAIILRGLRGVPFPTVMVVGCRHNCQALRFGKAALVKAGEPSKSGY